MKGGRGRKELEKNGYGARFIEAVQECEWKKIVVLVLAFSVSSVKQSCGRVIHLLSLVLVMRNLKKGATAAPKTVVCLKVGSTKENLFSENLIS